MNVLSVCLHDRAAQMYLDKIFIIFLEMLLISKVKVYVCMFVWGWRWTWCSQKLAGLLAMPFPLRKSSPSWIMSSANCDKSLRLPNKQFAPENTKDQQSRWHLTVCESVCESVSVRLPILSDFTADTECTYAPESKENKTSMTPLLLQACVCVHSYSCAST